MRLLGILANTLALRPAVQSRLASETLCDVEPLCDPGVAGFRDAARAHAGGAPRPAWFEKFKVKD